MNGLLLFMNIFSKKYEFIKRYEYSKYKYHNNFLKIKLSSLYMYLFIIIITHKSLSMLLDAIHVNNLHYKLSSVPNLYII